MSSSSNQVTARVIITCHKPDCHSSFESSDVRDLHFVRAHYQDVVPKHPVNEVLATSLLQFLEHKKQVFRYPPQKLEINEDKVIFHCFGPNCKQTFASEDLRDFHFNRMHHSRHLSMLPQLIDTENEEHHKKGHECLKADCDSRFLSAELRDFHYERTHPKLWNWTREVVDKTKTSTNRKKFKEDIRRNPDSIETMSNGDNVEDDVVMSTSELDCHAIDITNPAVFDEKKDTKLILSHLPTPELAKGTDKVEIVVENMEVMAMTGEIESLQADLLFKNLTQPPVTVGKSKSNPQSVFLYRSRSQMMMDRNALANPGASKWVIRN